MPTSDPYRSTLCLLIHDGLVSEEQVKDAYKRAKAGTKVSPKDSPTWKDAEALCESLLVRVQANGYRAFLMNQTNVSAMDKLLRIDRRSYAEVELMIEWCTRHEFWSANIRSPLNLRKHFDTMEAQHIRRPSAAPSVAKAVQDTAEWKAEIESRHAKSVSVERGFLKSALMGRNDNTAEG